MKEDTPLLARIRKLAEERPSYGYRRVTALLNRQAGYKQVNHKRVYRVMKQALMLLPKVASRPNRNHTGTIMTLKSNLRWCSDDLEIRCWNGEKVYVAFSLDCCDREVLAWVAGNQYLRVPDIENLIAISVEARFGNTKTSKPIEWLSNSGGCYTANETKAFAASCGLVPRTMLAYSPESNGMAEAFVNTLKRDYVYLADLWDIETVLKMLPRWIDDDNEIHPHKELNMQSPRQFRRLNAS